MIYAKCIIGIKRIKYHAASNLELELKTLDNNDIDSNELKNHNQKMEPIAIGKVLWRKESYVNVIKKPYFNKLMGFSAIADHSTTADH